MFEWYTADVIYDEGGAVIEETITGGPFQGQWQTTCPAGDQPAGGEADTGTGGDNSPAAPPKPTATPDDGGGPGAAGTTAGGGQ